MKTFYESQRRRLGLLLEADGSPIRGRWSFDVENRRRLPKG
ncbi:MULTISPECIES: cryptochrome/photolyase family protein [unclassified Synechococcus]|nr:MULTISPECIES: cryptochrome/photolyase family protein [unclassified Synechococcus]